MDPNPQEMWSPAASPLPKRRRTRIESGYCSSVSAQSPFSVMPQTPATPGTPMSHSAYSPMGYQGLASISTNYSESEDEGESLDVSEAQDLSEIGRVLADKGQDKNDHDHPEEGPTMISPMSAASKPEVVQAQVVHQAAIRMEIDPNFFPNFKEHSFSLEEESLTVPQTNPGVDLDPNPTLWAINNNELLDDVDAYILKECYLYSPQTLSEFQFPQLQTESDPNFTDFLNLMRDEDLNTVDWDGWDPGMDFSQDDANLGSAGVGDPVAQLSPSINVNVAVDVEPEVVQEPEVQFVVVVDVEDVGKEPEVEFVVLEPLPVPDQPLPKDFIFDGITIPISAFQEAFSAWETEHIANSHRKPPQAPSSLIYECLNKAGRAFFKALFLPDELKNRTYSGKINKSINPGRSVREQDKLDRSRLLAIDRLLAHLKYCWNKGKTLADSIPTNYKKDLEEELTPKEIEHVVENVYQQFRNQYMVQAPKRRAERNNNVAKKKRRCGGPESPSATEVEVMEEQVEEMAMQLEHQLRQTLAIEVTEGHFIAYRHWADAYRWIYVDELIKGGTILFSQLFTEQEIMEGTPTGKNNTIMYDPFKIEVIYEIVARFQNKKRYPYDFVKISKMDPITGEPFRCKICPAEVRETIKKKVPANAKASVKAKKVKMEAHLQEQQQQDEQQQQQQEQIQNDNVNIIMNDIFGPEVNHGQGQGQQIHLNYDVASSAQVVELLENATINYVEFREAAAEFADFFQIPSEYYHQ